MGNCYVGRLYGKIQPNARCNDNQVVLLMMGNGTIKVASRIRLRRSRISTWKMVLYVARSNGIGA